MMKLIPTSTRGKVRAATFLTAGVVVLGGFAIQGQVRAAQYQHLLNKTYEYAFAELSTSVSQLDTALQKGSMPPPPSSSPPCAPRPFAAPWPLRPRWAPCPTETWN